jgi:hypothetical protein
VLPRRNAFRTVSHDRVVSGIYLFGGICKKPQVGKLVSPTVDVTSLLGWSFLAHADRRSLDADYARLREIEEDGMFDIE